MALQNDIPSVKKGDWNRLKITINKLRHLALGNSSNPTYAGLTLTDLTASTLIGANASKALESVTVGTGLDYTRPNLTLSHLGIEALTDPGGDRILFWDDSATACKWLTISTGLQISTTNLTTKDSEIVHDNLSGFVANEHIDHTSVTLTAGTGLTGGGDISANRTFAVDGVLEDLDTLGANPFAGDPVNDFLVGTAAGTLAWQSGATARTSIGLGTGDSPQFTGIELGHASDTTITRVSAGVIAVEGTTVMMVGAAPTAHSMASHTDDDTYDIATSGTLDVVGDAAFGTAALTSLIGIYLSKHKTITSAGDNSYRRGIYASVQVGKTGLADYTGVVTGIGTQVQLDDLNTQDWTNANAIRGFNADVNTESSSAGTVTGISGYSVSANIQDAATVTNFYGYKVGTIQSFGSKLTNAYGLHIADITAGATLNYAILTGAGLVEFGGVATLADASTLKTSAAPTADAEIANKKYVDDTAGGGGFTSKCSVYRSTNQSINDSTWTKVQFDTENYDTDGEYDNATNYRFTATNAGYYTVASGIKFFQLNDTDYAGMSIYVNGADVAKTDNYATQANDSTSFFIVKDLYLAATDYVEIFVYQVYGAARNVLAGNNYTWMTIHRFA